MALTKTLTVKDNFGDDKIIKDAYIQVSAISGGKQGMLAHVDVFNLEKTKVVRQEALDFKPLLDGKNFIAQAYDHLKTLTAYAGAVDC